LSAAATSFTSSVIPGSWRRFLKAPIPEFRPVFADKERVRGRFAFSPSSDYLYRIT
jgi:hypothetical protein